MHLHLSKLGRSALDLLFPPRCKVCLDYAAAVDTSGVCKACADMLRKAMGVRACPTCAAAVAPYEIKNARCSECRNLRSKIKAAVRVGTYHSVLGSLIRRYKYQGHEELTPLLGTYLAEVVFQAPWCSRVEAVVSVPTHWRRRIWTPFHAAELLGQWVARSLSIPHVALLERVRAGKSQVGLSLRARQTNVQGAFRLCPGVVLKHPRLLLIDDVRTTGATLGECAKVLHRAGAGELYAAVVVRAGYIAATGQTFKEI